MSVQEEAFQYLFKIGRCGFIYPSDIDRHPIIALTVLVIEHGLYLIFVFESSDFFLFLILIKEQKSMGNIMVNIMENIMGNVETLAFLDFSLSPPLLLSLQVPRIHGQTLLWVDKSCDLQSFRGMQPVVQQIFAVVASAKSIEPTARFEIFVSCAFACH